MGICRHLGDFFLIGPEEAMVPDRAIIVKGQETWYNRRRSPV